MLGGIVLAAAVLIAAVPFAAGPFLDVSVKGLDEVSAGAAIGSFFAVLALFAPPVTLLGMVAPFAVRLAIDDVREAGSRGRPSVCALDGRQPPGHVPFRRSS